jgi:hypothetical protein
MRNVIFTLFRIGSQVFKVDFDYDTNHVVKTSVHRKMKGSPCIN